MKQYAEDFRKGLNAYVEDKLIKQSSVADRAGIRRDTFSRILGGGRRIYAEEAAAICEALGVSFEFLMEYYANTRSIA